MARKKVIEKTSREVDEYTGKPAYHTSLSFIGGIDLGEITDHEYNQEHLFLRNKGKENRIHLYTSYSLKRYSTTLNAVRNKGTQLALKGGTNRELGYIDWNQDEKEALAAHKRVVDTLKEAYFSQ